MERRNFRTIRASFNRIHSFSEYLYRRVVVVMADRKKPTQEKSQGQKKVYTSSPTIGDSRAFYKASQKPVRAALRAALPVKRTQLSCTDKRNAYIVDCSEKQPKIKDVDFKVKSYAK